MLHWSVGIGNSTSFICGEMVGRRLECAVEVDESVAHGIFKGMVNGTAAVVVNGALVDRDGSVGGRSSAAVEAFKGVEWEEEERVSEGSENGGDD